MESHRITHQPASEGEPTSEGLKLLRQTEGYQKLSRRQQQMLTTPLYMEERVNRTDPENYETSKNIFQEHTRQFNCHRAVYSIEHEELFTEEGLEARLPGHGPLEKDQYYSRGRYLIKSGQTLDDVSKHIEDAGFPCVVIMGEAPDRPLHSLIALGKDDGGQIILWEKENLGKPYGLVRLNDVCPDRYNLTHTYFGTRQIETADDVVEVSDADTVRKKLSQIKFHAEEAQDVLIIIKNRLLEVVGKKMSFSDLQTFLNKTFVEASGVLTDKNKSSNDMLFFLQRDPAEFLDALIEDKEKIKRITNRFEEKKSK